MHSAIPVHPPPHLNKPNQPTTTTERLHKANRSGGNTYQSNPFCTNVQTGIDQGEGCNPIDWTLCGRSLFLLGGIMVVIRVDRLPVLVQLLWLPL